MFHENRVVLVLMGWDRNFFFHAKVAKQLEKSSCSNLSKSLISLSIDFFARLKLAETRARQLAKKQSFTSPKKFFLSAVVRPTDK